MESKIPQSNTIPVRVIKDAYLCGSQIAVGERRKISAKLAQALHKKYSSLGRRAVKGRETRRIARLYHNTIIRIQSNPFRALPQPASTLALPQPTASRACTTRQPVPRSLTRQPVPSPSFTPAPLPHTSACTPAPLPHTFGK